MLKPDPYSRPNADAIIEHPWFTQNDIATPEVVHEELEERRKLNKDYEQLKRDQEIREREALASKEKSRAERVKAEKELEERKKIEAIYHSEERNQQREFIYGTD